MTPKLVKQLSKKSRTRSSIHAEIVVLDFWTLSWKHCAHHLSFQKHVDACNDDDQEQSQSCIKTVMLLLFCCAIFTMWFCCGNFVTGSFVTWIVTAFQCNHVTKTSRDCAKFAMATVKHGCVFVMWFVITWFVTVFQHNGMKMSHVFVTAFWHIVTVLVCRHDWERSRQLSCPSKQKNTESLLLFVAHCQKEEEFPHFDLHTICKTNSPFFACVESNMSCVFHESDMNNDNKQKRSAKFVKTELFKHDICKGCTTLSHEEQLSLSWERQDMKRTFVQFTNALFLTSVQINEPCWLAAIELWACLILLHCIWGCLCFCRWSNLKNILAPLHGLRTTPRHLGGAVLCAITKRSRWVTRKATRKDWVQAWTEKQKEWTNEGW